MSLLLGVIMMGLQLAGTPLDDPREEARAQDLMHEIRCVACENEPISQSSSDIAVDMRERVRALVAQGKSDDEVRDWFAERYGAFVLFRPDSGGLPGKVLWGLPFGLLLVGGLVLVLRRRRPDASTVVAQPADHVDASEG